MAAPLNDRDVARYERLFRSRGVVQLLAVGAALLWLLAILQGAFYGALGYDGFVSIIYHHDSGVAMHGGGWYYLGIAPVVFLAALPIALYATSYVDTENVLVRGPGIPATLGVMHAFLFIAAAALALGLTDQLAPLLTNKNHRILHRGTPLYPPYYGRIVLILAAGMIAATAYHRRTLSYTYHGIGRTLAWTMTTAAVVFIGSLFLVDWLGDDGITLPTTLILSATVFCQALALYALHLRRWPRVLEAYGRGYCLACGYDLRGTIAANRNACPECGRHVPASAPR